MAINLEWIRFESERRVQTVCVCVLWILWSLLADFFVVTLWLASRRLKPLSICACPQISALSLPLMLTNLSLHSSGELWFLKGFCMFPMPLSVYVEENNISARNKRQIARDIERKSAKPTAASESHTQTFIKMRQDPSVFTVL